MIGSIIGAGASLFQTLLQHDWQEEANRENIKNMWSMYDKDRAYQNYLNQNGDLIKRDSMQRAGLNLNMESGGYPSLSAPASNLESVKSSNVDFQALMQGLQLDQQSKLINAQSRQLNADAERQEIENAREKSVDTVLSNYIKNYIDVPENEFVIDSTPVTYNKGTFEAKKQTREWESEVKKLDSQDIKNTLDKIIYDQQLEDSRVVQALKEMPYQSYRHLCESVDNLIKDRSVMDSVIALNNAMKENQDSQTELNRLEKKITENTNLNELIHKYLGDGALADFAQLLVVVLGAVTGRVNIGFNKGNVSSNSNVSSISSHRSVSTNTNYNYNRSN